MAAAAASRPEHDESSSFPMIVAWLSLGLAVLLFCGNTVPALRERTDLQETGRQLAELRERYDAALAQAWASTPEGGGDQAAATDLQSVLVAIDRIGWTPRELLDAFPPAPDASIEPAGR